MQIIMATIHSYHVIDITIVHVPATLKQDILHFAFCLHHMLKLRLATERKIYLNNNFKNHTSFKHCAILIILIFC